MTKSKCTSAKRFSSWAICASTLFDRDFGAAGGADHREADHRFAVQARQLARFGGAVADAPQIRKGHAPPARQDNLRGAQVLDGSSAAEGADGLLAASQFPRPRQIPVEGAHLAVHFLSGDPQGKQPIRVEVDAHFAAHAPEALHPRDTLDGEQGPAHVAIDKPAQLLD